MALHTSILVNLYLIIFVFSCIRSFPSPSKLDNEESFYFNRQLLSKKECVKYNSTFGKREPKDMLMNVSKIKTESKWMTRVKHYISYNRKNETLNNTTFIEIINNDKDCNCYSNEIVLDKGGIYQDFADIYFLSEKNCPMNYLVRFFSK